MGAGPVGQERYDDAGVLVDAHEDRWAWRARLKRNPATRRAYRAAVGVVGTLIVAVGIVAIPAPGPGWALVFVGLAVLASEFEKAAQLRDYALRHVRRWTDWIGEQALWVRALVALATLALVLAIFWTYLALVGVPGWLPDGPETWLSGLPGLG